MICRKPILAVAVLLLLSVSLQNVSQAYAWNFFIDATPEVRTVYPGHTTSYTVSVGLFSGPTQLVQLLVSPSPPELNGLTFAFTPSASGMPPFTRTLQVTVAASKAPGTYTIPVAGFNPSTGFRTDYVQLVVASPAPTTDWALSNPGISPVSPRVGDQVKFSVVLRALSTDRPYPQSVRVSATLDGLPIVSASVSYSGPTGTLLPFYTATPLTATEGPHTMIWTADPSPYEFNDPNRYNNRALLSFTVTSAPPPLDFSLSVTPVEQKVTAGSSVSYSVAVNLVSGRPQTVSLSLSGLPSGATYAFNPSSSDPTFTSTLTVSTTATAPAGSYSLTLMGSGGGNTKIATFELEIELAPEKGFTITVAPTSSIIEQGEQTTHVITLNALAGFSSSVELSASGLPSGVSAEFNPKILSPGSSSTLRIRTSRNTPTGAYAVTVVATGGGKTHDATVGLTLTKTATPSFLEMLFENTYLQVIIVLIVLIVILLAVLLRRR